MPLVVNGPPDAAETLRRIRGAQVHISGIAGLIDATRRAHAVIGVDSGPMHLAAALAKPGVAIFGPTDPARNGPYGGSLRVLRRAAAVTTYKRRGDDDAGCAPSRAAAVVGGAGGGLSGVSFPKAYADAVAKLRVPADSCWSRRSCGSPRPSWTSLAVGIPVSMLGLAIRAWAAGHLEKNLALAESGPYAHVRNPLYIGTLDGGRRIGDRVAAVGAGRAVRGRFRC